MTTTDDTRQRSIAEIIGWEPRAIEGRTWWVPPSWAPVSEDWNRTNCPVCLQIRAERQAAAAAWNSFMGRPAT